MRGGSAAVFMGMLSFLLPAAASGATFPGTNGEIAFLPHLSQCLEMVKADGTARHTTGACEPHPTLALPSARLAPDGIRVAAPVYDVVGDVYNIRVSNLDGSNPVLIAGLHNEPQFVRWSPDGGRLAIVEQFSPGPCCDAGFLHVENSDGSSGPGATTTTYTAAWSNDGRIAHTYNDYDQNFGTLSAENGDGTGDTTIFSGTTVSEPEWSPSSDRLAFERGGVAVINDDGTGLQQLNNAVVSQPEWSPDGQRILFAAGLGGNSEIQSIAADGAQTANLSSNPATDRNPIWSPDGTKIAFESNRDGDFDIYVMNRDGSGVVQVTNDTGAERLQDWQSIPITAYPRPRGATPIQVSMVPAYKQCTAPNRTHGPALSFPSCASPTQTSAELTVGTPDANARSAKSRGTVRYDAIAGAPATPADEADVQVSVELFDVYEQGTMADYTGELTARVALRITDKLNTPAPGGPGAATVSDTSLAAQVPCTATADTTEGAGCNVVTTFDAIVPGTVTETKRSIWALGPARLYDANDDVFMTQGLFIP